MKDKRRLLLGSLFFALMFFYLGVQAYFSFVYVAGGSYDGWFGRWEGPGHPVRITGTDREGPATALKAGDEFLAINGITPAEDPEIMGFANRVPPGTTFLMTVRRDNQELVIPITTVEKPARRDHFGMTYIFIQLIFLITGLAVFLLKPDNRQAWLLALMLGTFIGLSTSSLPLAVLGHGVVFLVAFAKILSLWSLPLFVRFFLNFPERSPILRRWPKLEAHLNWPFYLFVLPYFGGVRLPPYLKAWYFSLPPINWLTIHAWSGLSMPVLAGYLAAGLVCLVVNYRVVNRNARRRLHVIVIGSGAAVLTLLLVIASEFLGLQDRMPGLSRWLVIGMFITLPFIPLSFAYAIIRHKVIPISLIIRRSARYVLVSRGSAVLVIAGVCVVTFFVTDALFRYVKPSSGRVVGIISAVLAIIVWNMAYSFHRRVIAPLIDRHFFRESYDARQILAELSQSVRSTTDTGQLLELICTRIQKALHVENVTVFLRDEASGDYASAVSFDHQSNGKPAISSQNDVRLPADAYVIRRLSESGEPLNADLRDPNSSLHQRLTAGGNGSSLSEKEILEKLNTALLLPLAAKDRMLGLISLGPRLGDQPFSREDEQMLMSVVGQTTFAIENTRLIKHMIEDERRRQELEAENEQRAKELEDARQLQLSMLPKKVPQLPGLEIAAYMKTATEVGGDYYDFHVGNDGTLTVALGDATGHGLKAGTMVTAAKSLFEAFAQQPDLTHIFRQTSCALKRMNLRSLFMSMTMLKVKDNQLTVSMAGMPPVLIYRAASGMVEEIAIRGMPLGSITNFAYQQRELELGAGDAVILMSDGFPEMFNEDGEMLDYQRARTMLEEVAHQSPQEIIHHFVRTGEAWAGVRPADDDVTFVVLKVRDGTRELQPA